LWNPRRRSRPAIGIFAANDRDQIWWLRICARLRRSSFLSRQPAQRHSRSTTGIQALDLLGRKILRDRGAALNTLRRRISATAAKAEGDASLRPHASALQETWLEIAAVVDSLMTIDDESVALRNATPFLAAFGHAVVAWLWLDQAVEAASVLRNGDRGGTVNERDTDFYGGKLRACRFFFEAELPKIRPQLVFVASGSDVAAGMPPGAF
jgi:hypothetical protein